MIETLIQFVKEQLATNQFFQGGALIALIGILLASVRRIPMKLYGWLRWYSFVTIDIPDKDEAFQWVDKWLAHQYYTKYRARNLTVFTRRKKYSEDTTVPEIVLSPAPGNHYFLYGGRLVILHRERKEPSQEGGSTTSAMLEREVFTIKILGRKRDVARRLLEEARKIALPNSEDKITIHLRDTFGNGWRSPIYRPKRTLDSVILPEGQSERLIADMQTFLGREEWYNERCIPWRRGYLFAGDPGNGKSSLVSALASHFELGVCIIDVNNIDDYQLMDALSNLPPRCILLLEDMDCLYSQRNKSKDNDGRVSFSGMLNALDGVAASEGRIVILTTNKKHLLDKALLRPGRCDVHEYFYNATPSQAARLCQRFNPESARHHEFAEQVSYPVSMAALQGHLIKYDSNADNAIAHLDELNQETDNEPTKEQEETGTSESH